MTGIRSYFIKMTQYRHSPERWDNPNHQWVLERITYTFVHHIQSMFHVLQGYDTWNNTFNARSQFHCKAWMPYLLCISNNTLDQAFLRFQMVRH